MKDYPTPSLSLSSRPRYPCFSSLTLARHWSCRKYSSVAIVSVGSFARRDKAVCCISHHIRLVAHVCQSGLLDSRHPAELKPCKPDFHDGQKYIDDAEDDRGFSVGTITQKCDAGCRGVAQSWNHRCCRVNDSRRDLNSRRLYGEVVA